jgi:hypothetical protein
VQTDGGSSALADSPHERSDRCRRDRAALRLNLAALLRTVRSGKSSTAVRNAFGPLP